MKSQFLIYGRFLLACFACLLESGVRVVRLIHFGIGRGPYYYERAGLFFHFHELNFMKAFPILGGALLFLIPLLLLTARVSLGGIQAQPSKPLFYYLIRGARPSLYNKLSRWFGGERNTIHSLKNTSVVVM